MKLPLSAIILTYNEEKNIQACLESVKNFVQDIFIVDSFSTDQTLSIAKKYTDKILQHEFENYGKQRNWALDNLPIKTEWVLNLDADHRVTDKLKEELCEMFSTKEHLDYNGLLVSRKTIFMGKWIRYGGHYPVYHCPIFKDKQGKCEETLYDQHFLVNGKLKKIKGDIEDIVSESLDTFINRHNKWSTLEALSQTSNNSTQNSWDGRICGNEIEKRRFMKNNIFMIMPLFFRSFIYFNYRYFFRLGFLDGKEGLIFHFLQGCWFRFLVDAKIYETRKKSKIKV